MSFGHYRLYQTLQATRGELLFYDIWPNEKRYIPVITRDFPLGISWQEYLYNESCTAGFHPYEYTEEKRYKIYRNYQELIEKHLK